MTTNPYVSQLIEQTGMTEREARQSTSTSKRSFPCNIYGRYFATQSEYDEALHEFLNGM